MARNPGREYIMGDLFAPAHLFVIFLLALLVFGPGKLPAIGKDLGKSIREFRKAVSEPPAPDPAAAPAPSPDAPPEVRAQTAASSASPRDLG